MKQDSVYIVTGAGRGVGSRVALMLAKGGAKVVGVSRTEAELSGVAEEAGGNMTGMIADVCDSEQVRRVIEQTYEKHGRIDGVAHCAGLAPFISIEQMTDKEWRDVIDTNLSSAFYLMREAWGIMRQQGGGAFVNVSSVAARDPFNGFGAYAPAKAGINALGRVAACEGQSVGIRVYTVAPGAIETAMFRKLFTPSKWPKEKCLTPEEVAAVIVDCLLGRLKHTTGEVIYMQKAL